MAYKFQLGPANMSGSLEQGGNIDIEGSGELKMQGTKVIDSSRNITAVSLSGSNTLKVGGTVRFDGVADATADVAADSFYFLDGDSLMKKERMSDYASTIAGDGLAAASGVLAVGVDDSSIETNSDALRIKASGVTNAMLAGSIADSKLNQITTSDKVAGSAVELAGTSAFEDSTGLRLKAATAGDGLSMSSQVLALDLNELTDATVAVGADSFAFIDATGNVSRKESLADYATAIAGTGLKADAGVLEVRVSGSVVRSSDKIGLTGSIAGAGLAYAGGINSISGLSVNVDDSGIEISSDSLRLKDDGVTLAKMASLASGKLILGDGSNNPAAVTMSGDATLSAAGALTIANDAVEQAMIADDAVGADQLAANAVVENSIVDNAVSLAKMASLARGSIILGDASGDPSALVKGGANTFLQSDGTDVAYVTLGGDATLSAGTLSIGATKVTDAMLNDDCANGLAGVGLVAASGIMALSLFELPSAAVNVAADSIAIVDADDTNISKKESIADLVAAMAGAGLKATAGVLSTESGTATAAGDADLTLVEGMNYGSTTLTADRTWSLPAAPSVGDIVHVKAPANLAGFDVTISKQGSHAIDGSATIELETAGAAVSLMYVAANTWVIF